MSIKESSATALVRFTGLGIICFNKELGRGEVAAIRDDKHALSIRIQRPVFQEGTGSDHVAYSDIATYEKLPKEEVEIEIKAADRPAIEGYEIYQSGEFDRLGSADTKDFRWLVRMESLHGNGDALLNPTGQPRHPLTKIYIGNGLFYTQKLDTNLFFEKVEVDASGRRREPQAFGNVGETMGVKIEAEEVSFTIRIGGREESHTLKRIEGLPFRIEIKNMDYSGSGVYSDMEDYYGYLASPDGTRVDLSPVVEETAAKGGSVNQVDFCHPIVSDLSSIDKLSEP
ncbi:MAG: hypothetical protein ICV60_03070 [Pyrinomonadaceae bacterium]|nr:hypothetical protein [Pyrinomonadaceae bacterium]